MLTTLLGAVVCCLSGYAVVRWFSEFIVVLKGLLPICFFCGGLIAVVIGLTPRPQPSLKRQAAEKDKKND